MAWVYLDNGIARHPKIIKAGNFSSVSPWLFVAGLAYCREHLTGGLIPIAMVPNLTPLYKKRAMEALINARLWERPDAENIAVHDYAEWNDQEDRQRAGRSRKAQAAAKARWNGHAQALPEHPPSNAQAHPSGNALAMPSPDSVPDSKNLNPQTTTSGLQPRPRRVSVVAENSHVTGGWTRP
jgi:hypothetical protein